MRAHLADSPLESLLYKYGDDRVAHWGGGEGGQDGGDLVRGILGEGDEKLRK